ncbi:tight adherence pilus pseudopilin TadF [Photobacterium leiognathi]
MIELAFILMFLCLLTLFTTDIAMQLFTRTKLDPRKLLLSKRIKRKNPFL